MQVAIPREGVPVEPPEGVRLVRADNPGLLSLAGTNTWVLAGRKTGRTVVIDPGPPLTAHLDGIRAAGRPGAIVLTHHHLDHSESAAALAAEFEIPIYAASPDLATRSRPLVDGDVIDASGWHLAVIATPGHTADSICLRIKGALFTGDTLLGESTTIIAPPTGSLDQYLKSMNRLAALTDLPGFPGHGPAFGSVGAWASQTRQHRLKRLAQVARIYTRLAAAAADPDAAPRLARVASTVYSASGEPVEPYIEAMVDAQLRYLADRGDISRDAE
jgi:glyoxylase-like metal-dependent hydrolase (beta-lactamase superfamily II)